jgi:hypothetical protein
VSAGVSLQDAAAEIFSLDQALRCYLLDGAGVQIGENVVSPKAASHRDPRHDPLRTARGANWSHRHYFRRALANPSKTQTSRPYVSLTDPGMCVTLSRTVRSGGELAVLCSDLGYPLQ